MACAGCIGAFMGLSVIYESVCIPTKDRDAGTRGHAGAHTTPHCFDSITFFHTNRCMRMVELLGSCWF